MDSKERIDQVFANLDRWRHLPSYQLERRADIFFSLYLPEILKKHFNCGPWTIIPEFPVHVSVKNPKAKSNLSVKIDYLAVTYNPDRLVFVELKTDMNSRREVQDRYLLAAQAKGMSELLDGLQRIYRATHAKPKYDRLLEELSKAGIIDPKRTLRANRRFPRPEILYIQPRLKKKSRNILSFTAIAKTVGSHKDELSVRFAKSLKKWASEPAGCRSSTRANKGKS